MDNSPRQVLPEAGCPCALTPDERRRLEDLLRLERKEHEDLLELAQFASRPHKDDPSIRNLDAVIDITRKRAGLLAILKRAEVWLNVRQAIFWVGGLSGAVIAIMSALKSAKDLVK